MCYELKRDETVRYGFPSIFLLRQTSEESRRLWGFQAGEPRIKKVGEGHLGVHSHSKPLCRKGVTGSKEKHINNPERESSWPLVCLYLTAKSIARHVHL